jgi:SAM-dependent methyltransferase
MTLNHSLAGTSDYIDVNRAAYDALAKEYRDRREADREKDLSLIEPFVRLVRERFEHHPIRILDLGCGNGLNLAMFTEEGFEPTGIDISPRMLEVARESCPSAELICDNILDHNFSDGYFHGVFAKAIVHLFPKSDALRLFNKVYRMLKPDGILYVTTTLEPSTMEGLREKSDYHLKAYRYRRTWTECELKDALITSGFRILEFNFNSEPSRQKTWVNFWAVKSLR